VRNSLAQQSGGSRRKNLRWEKRNSATGEEKEKEKKKGKTIKRKT
jgi:hypothetical protein